MTSLAIVPSIVLIFIVFWTLSRASLENADHSPTWATLQQIPLIRDIGSMPFGSFRVKIYEHMDRHKGNGTRTRKRYLYNPIALLDHKSAICVFNDVTNQAEMRFRVELWNEKVETEIVEYLTKIEGEQVDRHQVEVFPLEKVILASTGSPTVYSLSNDWLPSKMKKSMIFSLKCKDQKYCEKLANTMEKNPYHFENLQLFFSQFLQTVQTKDVTFRIQNLLTGEMVKTLLQRYQGEEQVSLTEKDEVKLLTEMTNNIIAQNFETFQVLVSSESRSKCYEILKDLLVFAKLTITQESDSEWNAVFWDEEKYRPDKTSQTLNEIYKNQSKENQRRLSNAFSTKISKENVDLKEMSQQLFDSVEIKSDVYFPQSRVDSDNKELVENLYERSRDHIEWNGEKFIPKPLTLRRIFLGLLWKEKELLQKDFSVRVHYSTIVLSTPVYITLSVDNTVTTTEWDENIQKIATRVAKKFEAVEEKIATIKTERRLHDELVAITIEKVEREFNSRIDDSITNMKNYLNSALYDTGKSIKNETSEILEEKSIKPYYSTEKLTKELNATRTAVIESEKRLREWIDNSNVNTSKKLNNALFETEKKMNVTCEMLEEKRTNSTNSLIGNLTKELYAATRTALMESERRLRARIDNGIDNTSNFWKNALLDSENKLKVTSRIMMEETSTKTKDLFEKCTKEFDATKNAVMESERRLRDESTIAYSGLRNELNKTKTALAETQRLLIGVTKGLNSTSINVQNIKSRLYTPTLQGAEKIEAEKNFFNLIKEETPSLKEIERILDEGVDVNCVNEHGRTPLLQLTYDSNRRQLVNLELVRRLIQKGANVNAKNNDERTPLHLLCLFYKYDNLIDIARLLIKEGANVNEKGNDGWTALHYLCVYYKKDNFIDIARLLIEGGANVNEKGNDGWTALHYLCVYYKKDNFIDIVRLLIEGGANVNEKRNDGWAVLHYLCVYYKKDNLIDIVRLLIENGVDVNAKKNKGTTALHYLFQFYKKDNLIDIVRLLIENGANVNAKDDDGWAVLDSLCSFYEKENLIDIARLLIQSGVDANLEDYSGKKCKKLSPKPLQEKEHK